MALHHHAAAVDGFAGGELRKFIQDKRRHGIGERLDDAGNDQQEAPQEDEDGHEHHAAHLAPVIAEVEQVAKDVGVHVHQQFAEGVYESYSQGQKEKDFHQEGEAGCRIALLLGCHNLRIFRHVHDVGYGGEVIVFQESLGLVGRVDGRAGKSADNKEINQGCDDCFSPVSAQGSQGHVLEIRIALHLFEIFY